MLEGITVLNTYVVHSLTGLFGALMLLLLVLAVILGLFEKWGACVLTIGIMFSIGMAAMYGAPPFVHEDEIYQVLISEEVSFVEFNETYEIVSQEGLIYEIKLKEK